MTVGEIITVGVGASAGGLEALREMLAAADPGHGAAYVVVQHLDPNHESLMAELLARHTRLTVRQARDGEAVEAGHVYVIPPGHGLGIEKRRLRLTGFSQPRGLRRPIDDFFAALAEDQGESACGVVLSGTGADGSTGLRAIKEHGGICIAQDPLTARYDGMPLAAIGTGLADFVVPADEVIDALTGYFAKRETEEARVEEARQVADHVDDLCGAVHSSLGHDFTGYKRSTIVRRIERRMQILGIDDSEAYLARIRGNHDECETLFRELLINVTRFFRDPEQFEQLRLQAIVPLVEENRGEEIRVWVPGCSSGEEAYTIAMLIAAELRRARKSALVQVFATDIDERMLAVARAGIYPTVALADIPEEYRELYTIGRNSNFQIAPSIRDMIRFSAHSLIKDPPFSRLDLISCRNVLIYFGDRLQAQTMPVFHYALRPGGCLFLGPSESIGRHEDLFVPIDQKSRLFRRGAGRAIYPVALGVAGGASHQKGFRPAERERATRGDWEDSYAVERILERYAPPSMRVNADGEILTSSGQFSRYFAIAPTQSGPVFAQSIARPGLREVLPTLLKEIQRDRQRKVVREVEVLSDFGRQVVDVIADPLPDNTHLLVFRDRAPFEAIHDDDLDEIHEFDSHENMLQEELRLTRLRLRSAVEELETANEELKSSNEEMMSMNEELQSTNEELTTVNDELKSKVDQLTVANADLKNFFDSTELPLLVLDRHLRLRNFTAATAPVFPLRDGDRGRPLGDLRSNIREAEALLDKVRGVVRDGTTVRMRVESLSGSSIWAVSVTPYRTLDGVIDGAMLAFLDMTNALDLEAALRSEEERLRLALAVAEIGVWEYDIDTGETVLDEKEQFLFGVTPGEAGSIRTLFDKIHPEDRKAVEEAINLAIVDDGEFEARFRVSIPEGGWRHLRGLGRVLRDRGRPRIVGVSFDRSADYEADSLRDLMIREMNHRVKNLFSIMSALIRLAARDAKSPRELADLLTNRIAALARSHDLSLRHDEGPLRLSEVVKIALGPYGGAERFTTGGDTVVIKPEDLTPLALVLHEWATNSAKYGVLGPIAGALAITWEKLRGGEVSLTWTESYDLPVESDGDKVGGFGSELLRLSAAQLRGRLNIQTSENRRITQLVFKPNGT